MDILTKDSEGFTIRRNAEGDTAEFGPSGDRLTEWEDIEPEVLDIGHRMVIDCE